MRVLLYAALALLVAGCGSIEKTERSRHVTVEWLGHNCFKITSSLGITVVTDPFNPKILTYPAPKHLLADVLLISHEDDTTNFSNLVENIPQVFRSSMGIGANRASGLLITGVNTEERTARRSDRLNVAYTWVMEGVRLCHLGSPSGALGPEQIRELGRPDVLFFPVGSPSSLSDKERERIIRMLQPRIIVPMGYSTRHTMKRALGKPHAWLNRQPRVNKLTYNSFRVSRDALPDTTIVMVPALPQ